MRLAEAGNEVARIAAITGHSIANVHQILETYPVRTYTKGKAAIIKLEDDTAAVQAARKERLENAAASHKSVKPRPCVNGKSVTIIP